MFGYEKSVEIERRILAANDERAKAGLPPASRESLLHIVADELSREIDAKWLARITRRAAASRPVQTQAAAPRATAPTVRPVKPTTPPAKPLARPAAAAKPPVPPHIASDRARVSAVIAAAPVGAEAERDEAIASGASVEEFRNSLAARVILDARRRAGG